MAHRKDLKTRANVLTYDFDLETGWLFMPEDCCTDMAGCIALFKAIDPKVWRIITYAGTNRDTVYRLTKDQWAVEPPSFDLVQLFDLKRRDHDRPNTSK